MKRRTFLASLLALIAAPVAWAFPKKKEPTKERFYRTFINRELFGCEIKRLHPEEHIFAYGCHILWRDERDSINLRDNDTIAHCILRGYCDLEGAINSVGFGMIDDKDRGLITGATITNCTCVGMDVNVNSPFTNCSIYSIPRSKPGQFQGLKDEDCRIKIR